MAEPVVAEGNERCDDGLPNKRTGDGVCVCLSAGMGLGGVYGRHRRLFEMLAVQMTDMRPASLRMPGTVQRKEMTHRNTMMAALQLALESLLDLYGWFCTENWNGVFGGR